MGRYTGRPGVDAVFQHAIKISVEEVLEERRKRIAFLARYGRQSMLQWDNVEVNEIRWMHHALYDLMESEGSLQEKVEDG